MIERYGGWIMTYSGKKFWPLDPDIQDIDILDIAHALSNICRYGGHSREFYSVAEHCVHMSRYAKEYKLWALLHDATEAYLMDIPRPIKPHLRGYVSSEKNLMDCIASFAGLPTSMPTEVKYIDNRIIVDEMQALMNYLPERYRDLKPLGINIECWSPKRAKTIFLKEYFSLKGNQEG